ncbi:MAG: TatD family hydrolase [Nitrosopumilaceae archaeon]|nr:TatD family hydrolase [Nitrosopumilaceae archaeon]
MVWMFDSHIHLSDPAYEDDLDSIIKGMENMHIQACCVSMDSFNSRKTLEIAKKSKLILPFIGIHPECASDNLESMLNLIQNNIESISGIGEIGLDPTYVKTEEDWKKQVKIFESLLSIAEKYQKPVSIHSRKSLDDIFEIMESFSTENALLHWFDGSKKQLNKAMDMGFFVSFGPVLVYANDKQTLLKKTNEDKILVETDGPVRFSRCFEMKQAQIGFIPSVIFSVSKILNKQYDEVVSILEKNSNKFLGK